MELYDLVQPGMVVVDVGANVGTFTRDFLQRGAMVWAIEPHPDCHHALGQAIPADRLIRAAVSDVEGETLLYRSAMTEHGSLYPENVIEPHGSFPVRTVTLDGLQARGELPAHIDLLKVDTQGAELAILRGAETLIRTQHPIWFIEFWPMGLRQAGASVPAVVAFLADRGYVPLNQPSWDKVISYCAQIGGHSSIDVLMQAA